MTTTPNYGRQYRPEYYFEGEDLRIAKAIYNGENYQLNNLTKDQINRISFKGMSLFLYTIYVDNEEAMNLLLKKGGDANMFTKVKSFSSESWLEQTPLSFASQRPKISYIKTLLSYQANINDNRTTPALLCAVGKRNRELVDYLLNNGANINIQENITKSNALLEAADILDYDMVNHLLDRGANPMQRNVTGDCLAWTVQYDIKKGRGTDEFKKTLQDLKKRLEGMGVVFPVEKIPPKEDDTSYQQPVSSPQSTKTPPPVQSQNPNKKRWSIFFDDDETV